MMDLDLDADAGLIAKFRQFVARHWTQHQDHQHWQSALRDAGWHCADWPEAEGGPGWNLATQWHWARTCADALTPLQGDEITRLAPLLLALGTSEQRQHLAGIKQGQPWQFVYAANGRGFNNEASLDGRQLRGRFNLANPAMNICLLVNDQLLLLEATVLQRYRLDDSQILLTGHELSEEAFLGNQAANKYLALHQSPLNNLMTQLHANKLLAKRLADYTPNDDQGATSGDRQLERNLAAISNDTIGSADDSTGWQLERDLAELAIATQALEAMFLRDLAPAMQNLKYAEMQLDTLNLLGKLLGYYRLLEAAAGNTGNEPDLPMAAERNLLASMQDWAGINTMVLKDLLGML